MAGWAEGPDSKSVGRRKSSRMGPQLMYTLTPFWGVGVPPKNKRDLIPEVWGLKEIPIEIEGFAPKTPFWALWETYQVSS